MTMDQQSGLDRREQKQRRIGVSLRARISTIEPEIDLETGQPFFRTSEERCLNVSGGGAMITADELVPPGHRLMLELMLPSGESIQTIARVAWTRARLARPGGGESPGFGVEFMGGSARDFVTLERFIQRQLRRSAGPAPGSVHAGSARPF